jgi:hypothetical protein
MLWIGRVLFYIADARSVIQRCCQRLAPPVA